MVLPLVPVTYDLLISSQRPLKEEGIYLQGHISWKGGGFPPCRPDKSVLSFHPPKFKYFSHTFLLPFFFILKV